MALHRIDQVPLKSAKPWPELWGFFDGESKPLLEWFAGRKSFKGERMRGAAFPRHADPVCRLANGWTLGSQPSQGSGKGLLPLQEVAGVPSGFRSWVPIAPRRLAHEPGAS